jgi:hypothetical protein
LWHRIVVLEELVLLFSVLKLSVLNLIQERIVATPELKRLVAGFPPRRPSSSPGLAMWDLWRTKWRWGRFSQSTSVSPASLHSTKFSIITITRGRYNRIFSGWRAEWTQYGLHLPLCELKKTKREFMKSVIGSV